MKKTILTAVQAFIVLFLMVSHQNSALAQVATIKNWSAIYQGTELSQGIFNYTIPIGSNSNRLLVVAIASERTTVGPLIVSLSYGGQELTAAAGDIEATTIQHTALYYLDEAGLDAAGTNTTLSVSITGGTLRNTDVWAAVFDYINQITPLTDSKNYNSGTGPVPSYSFNPALMINAHNLAVEVIGSYNSGTNPRTPIYAEGWAMILERTAYYPGGFTGLSMRNAVAGRTIPASDISDQSTINFDKTSVGSMTGLSMNFLPPPPPTSQASDVTFSDITSSSFTVKWTNGDGTNRLVIVSEGSAVTAVPADDVTYSANNIWMNGQEIEAGNYVVYNGTADSINVVNLEAGITYHVAVYEFSGPSGMEDYLTETEPARGSTLTLPETATDGDYRSKTTGNWSSATSWQIYSDGLWTDATTAPSFSDGSITVRTGHTITVDEAVTADQLVIDAGGQVAINQGVTFTINDLTGETDDPVDCVVKGTLLNGGVLAAAGELSFGIGSLYHHATDGGVIPEAEWASTSTCLITGITGTAPTGFGQSFGNLSWNCPDQGPSLDVAMNENITVVGNFNLTSTGSGRLSITDGNNPLTMTVLGDYIQTGGTFILNNGLPSTAVVSLYLAGNMSFTGGTITEASSSGRGAVVFNGDGAMQLLTSGGTFVNTIDFTVESGSYLQMGTSSFPSFLTGSKGTFTLSAGATLGITSPYGITFSNTNTPSGGNIRVEGTRSFDPGANYIYNGAADQITGNGLPATVNSLTLDNTGKSIKFTEAHSVTEDFIITAGSRANLGTFTHSTSFLTLGGEAMIPGSYGGLTSGADNIIPEYFDEATGIINNNPEEGTWLGITTEWNLVSNWVGGVPQTSSDARITSYAPNQPVISGATAYCNLLTIDAGATLTVAGTAEIVTVQNSGTVTINPGGTATFDNVVNSGILNLESGPSAMFSFITDNFSGTGTVNAKLFLTGGLAGDPALDLPRWHYLAVPFQQSKSVLTAINPDNLMWYNETAAITDMWEGWQWHDGFDDTTPITDLQLTEGYSFYHDDDTYVTFTGNSLLTSLPQNDLSFTNFGWNFVGNSLSCGINWDDVLLDGDVDPTVNFLKDYQEHYYIQGGPGVPAGTTGSIPPLQGFFVQANAAGASLDFSGAREHNDIAYYKGSLSKSENKSSFPLVRLSVGDGNLSDETVIWFNENSTVGKDRNYDAEKRISDDSRVQIWSNIPGHSFAINGIPFPEKSIDIPITVRIPADGKYSISQNRLENQAEGYAYYLKDLEQNSITNLNSISGYSFSGSKGIINKRFVLTIRNLSAGNDINDAAGKPFNIYTASGILNIELLSEAWEGSIGSIKVIDLTGRTLIDSRNVEFSRSSLIQLPVEDNKGLFIVELKSSQLRYSGRVVVK